MLKNTLTRLRYAVGAPFSKALRGKERWIMERPEWEARGIAHWSMRNKVYVVPRTGAVCITVSKSANTTLKFMLHADAMQEQRNVHPHDHLLTSLADTGRALNDLTKGEDRIFTFVRHPVSRFWSAYQDKIFEPSWPKTVDAIARHLKIPRSDTYPPELVLEYVRAASPVWLDEHIAPQWASTAIEFLPIDFVGRVERMAEDIGKLRDLGYLDERQVARYGHLNSSRTKTEIADKARIDRLIRDVYAKDMELFGYE